MNNWGYREIRGFDTQGLKQLNDSLMAIWAKVMGEGKTQIAGKAATLKTANAASSADEAIIAPLLASVQSLEARVAAMEAQMPNQAQG